jgi:HEAT repeat protein
MALGEQDDDLLLDVGLPLVSGTDDPDRLERAVLRGLRRLRSGRALAWARASAHDLASGSAARAVLAVNADESDLPQLRSLLEWASDQHAIYDQCSIVDALHRLGDTAAVGQISALYESTVYSYLRRRCTLALAALHPAFPESLAVEALWDCEAETRRCGIERAALSDPVRKRLLMIAGDTIEELGTRQAAEARLA